MRGLPSAAHSTPTPHAATHPQASHASRVSVDLIYRGSSMNPVTRSFRVTGKVQGVYFRHSTRVEAERLGVRGVARNMPDGSVEVLVHGSREAVDELVEWLSRGPPHARVAGVEELTGSGAQGAIPASFSVE
jgi:acylphosphatase